MVLTVAEIATLVEGRVESGDTARLISGAASLTEAQPSDLSFLGNARYLADLKTSRAGAVLVRTGLDFVPAGAAIAVENPSVAFALILEKLRPTGAAYAAGTHPTAIIGNRCQIDPTASVQACAVIEDDVCIGAETFVGAHSFIGNGTTIGQNCLIHPRVTLREGTKIGNRVIIHSGAVLGSDGFGFEFVNGRHQKIAQIGIVQIDDDVEIGAGTTIDRARFGKTWIGEGTKIDNLVQIGHNVVIGKHCIIIAQNGIAGSVRIGNYVVIAGQTGIGGHLQIGDQVIIGAKSGVTKNIPAGEKWMGIYAEPAKIVMRKMGFVSLLPELFKRVKALEAKFQNKVE